MSRHSIPMFALLYPVAVAAIPAERRSKHPVSCSILAIELKG